MEFIPKPLKSEKEKPNNRFFSLFMGFYKYKSKHYFIFVNKVKKI